MEKENSFEYYLRDISQIPLLEREEEIEWAKRIEKGDEKALEKLVISNLRFVIKIAKSYRGRGAPFKDLISEGNIGLMKAAEKYDYRKSKFSTYAAWWIKSRILKEINKHRPLKIPVNLESAIIKITLAHESLLNKRIFPSIGEIEELTNISASKIKELYRVIYMKSLDEKLDKNLDGDGYTFYDTLKDSRYNCEEIAIENLSKQDIKKALKYLTEQEREVLEFRFGLKDGASRTFEEISRKYNVTKQRIEQIEKRAIKKLKSNSKVRRILKEYAK